METHLKKSPRMNPLPIWRSGMNRNLLDEKKACAILFNTSDTLMAPRIFISTALSVGQHLVVVEQVTLLPIQSPE
jgi:hypothetical protein